MLPNGFSHQGHRWAGLSSGALAASWPSSGAEAGSGAVSGVEQARGLERTLERRDVCVWPRHT